MEGNWSGIWDFSQRENTETERKEREREKGEERERGDESDWYCLLVCCYNPEDPPPTNRREPRPVVVLPNYAFLTLYAEVARMM